MKAEGKECFKDICMAKLFCSETLNDIARKACTYSAAGDIPWNTGCSGICVKAICLCMPEALPGY